LKQFKFINIHSHLKKNDDEIVILNHRFGFDKIPDFQNFYSVGIHPWDASLNPSLIELEDIIKHPNCLAIGECGLDKIKGADLALQQKYFLAQLVIAEKHHKPIIIHCVKSFDEIQVICKPYLKSNSILIHGFNKNIELAKQLIQKGFYLSISKHFAQTNKLSELPIDKLFFETDDNKEIHIKEIYEIAAEKLNMKMELLKEKIYCNFTSFFGRNNE
jgi:TatD DNase family protein